ncbi:MAG: uroporphyrinogen decarboxylase family protein [Acidobacteriota bacterium]
MDLTGIAPEVFPYDHFLSVKEKRDRFIEEWFSGKRAAEAPVLITPPFNMWDGTCADRELFLRVNLWAMATSAGWASDTVFPHLQPWYGVGIHAAAFGCEYVWLEEGGAPQTYPVYQSADELSGLKTPDLSTCAPMQEVLERIRWYRSVTKDRLPISLTDTQSPNDTASLILEVSEFFTVSSYEPERVAGLMEAITNVIIRFAESQLEAIGPNLSLPGHQMLCHPNWNGISMSDDNMAFLSPAAYANACLPFNGRIAERFGGVAVHSCGNIIHNLPGLLQTPQLRQLECAGCALTKDTEPNPNEPEALRDAFKGTDAVLKVRVNKTELDLVDRFLAPGVKVAFSVTGVQTREESEAVYAAFKKRIEQVTRLWPRTSEGSASGETSRAL